MRVCVIVIGCDKLYWRDSSYCANYRIAYCRNKAPNGYFRATVCCCDERESKWMALKIHFSRVFLLLPVAFPPPACCCVSQHYYYYYYHHHHRIAIVISFFICANSFLLASFCFLYFTSKAEMFLLQFTVALLRRFSLGVDHPLLSSSQNRHHRSPQGIRNVYMCV